MSRLSSAVALAGFISADIAGSGFSGRRLQVESVFSSLRQLESDVASTRVVALSALLELGAPRTGVPYNVATQIQELLRKYPGQAEPIANALIAALDQENVRVRSGQPLTETDSEHYADLVSAVAGLRTPNSANALAGALRTGGMAMNGLAELGEAAVPAVIGAFKSDHLRSSVSIALQRILAVGDAAVREAVRKGLLQALSDTNPEVRIAALNPLAEFTDPEVRRAVEALASQDSFTTTRNGERVFPVRRAAETWLREQGLR